MARLTVIGSTNIDLIMRLPKLPSIGETVTDGAFVQTFGGKGANTAIGAARAGAHVTFVTCVGDDPFGKQALDNFAADALDTELARVAAGVATGTALIMFDQEGRNYLAVAPGANDALTPEVVCSARTAVAEADWVLLQNEAPAETVEAALDLATELDKPVLFNYAPIRAVPVRVDARTRVLVVNEVEASSLTGLTVTSPADAEPAARALLARGPQAVVVTLGSAGAWVASNDVAQHVPAFPVEAVDSTAAGDIFCGAMAVGLAEGRSLLQSARFGSAASAISVTRLGAQPSAPSRDEIMGLLGE